MSAKQTDEVVAECDEIKIERRCDREEWRDLNSGFAPRFKQNEFKTITTCYTRFQAIHIQPNIDLLAFS